MVFWKYHFQELHPLEIVLKKEGEERERSEEG